jgi:hypothetical protein
MAFNIINYIKILFIYHIDKLNFKDVQLKKNI